MQMFVGAVFVFLTVGVHSQTIDQFNCFNSFFNDPNNTDATPQLQEACFNVSDDSGPLVEGCRDSESGRTCFEFVSVIFNDCGDVNYTDLCRVVNVPTPSPSMQQCVSDAFASRQSDIAMICPRVSIPPSNVMDLDALCASEDCRSLLSETFRPCQFDVINEACGGFVIDGGSVTDGGSVIDSGSIKVFMAPVLVLLTAMTSIFF